MIAVAWVALLIGTLLVYHSLGARNQIYWLLLLSYVFYAWWAWRFLPVLILLTLATHRIAVYISRPQSAKERRRFWLWLGIALNAGALGALRFGYRSAPFESPFAVLGISFYVLQAISYLLDTYSGTLRAPHTLTDLALYLAYFPKLVAGPFERPQAFFRQLAQPRVVDDERLARAATLIAVGLTRKLVFADPLMALLPAAAFNDPSSLGSLTLAASLVGYAFVLYNDFAGYTSIARGVSCLFGIELSANFAQPFLAHSFTNLWTRWHITFSLWLRDYIYLPLSRRLLRRNLSRTNAANVALPPLVTMLACGLWHGASLHMLVWGALHGVYLIAERVGTLLWPPLPGVVKPWRRAVGVVVVFALSCLALVALRLPLDRALQFWRQLLSGPLGELPDARWLLYMLPSLWLDAIQLQHGEDTAFTPWPRLARATIMASAALLWLVFYAATAPTPFVYQGF